MKKIKFLTTTLAFSIAIFAAFAFNSKSQSKRILMEAYEKNTSTDLCTIDIGKINCNTIISAIPCTLDDKQLYDPGCTPLYKH